MTACNVCTLHNCPLRASLHPWTNALAAPSRHCSNKTHLPTVSLLFQY
ncbi:hypothetical protein IEO21_05599 [Rhodonia placenta]|uniref:Uncharacterized protein n=1 Tax=Rhodonia placenta TaxID=104341 RepID=A0A8H7P1X9_9APHY|nr:hypothetical protein IEO21_05599 [Postia placenta]